MCLFNFYYNILYHNFLKFSNYLAGGVGFEPTGRVFHATTDFKSAPL